MSYKAVARGAQGFVVPIDERTVVVLPRHDWLYLESFPDDLRGDALKLSQTIIVPDCASEPSRLAKVLAIGPEVEQNGAVKVGDTVLCPRYGGKEAKDAEGERYFLMQEKELLGVVGQ